jgi:hypothetical protein
MPFVPFNIDALAPDQTQTPRFPFGFQPDGGQAYDLSSAELASLSGSIPMRAATFEYIGRDGGDIEGLGAGVQTFVYQCFYTGSDYGDRLRGLRAAIQTQPKGLLTDPELGRIRAHCLGVDEYSVNYMTERDTVNFRISFRQDATDTTQTVGQVAGVSTQAAQFMQTVTKAAQIIGSVKSVVTDIAALPSNVRAETQGLLTTLAGLVNFSTIFANSCVAVATLGAVDFTIEAQRQAVFLNAESVITALRATGQPDAYLYPSLAIVRTLYAQALDLESATKRQSPAVKTVAVEGRQPVVVFAAQQYGGAAAIGKVQELITNNRIGSFGIPAGKSMVVVGATVDQGNGA